MLFCFVYFGGLSLLYREFVVQPFTLPSVMAPTLRVGDCLVADRISYLPVAALGAHRYAPGTRGSPGGNPGASRTVAQKRCRPAGTLGISRPV